MDNSNNMKSKAWVFISIGLILILIAILFHVIHLVDTQNKFLLFLNEFIPQILSHLGIAGLAIGIITFLFETPHWTHYFEKRLSKIVTEKEYLTTLSTEDLTTLQVQVLKAYFKNDDIGGEEGFLKYYQQNIQNIIGMPYRTNVDMDLQVSISDEDETKLRIKERITYHCLPNAGSIQKDVCYIPEVGEHAKSINFEVTLQHESLKSETNTSDSLVFDLTKLKELKACTEIEKGFGLDISQYNLSGLNIFVKADYLIDRSRFLGWRMSHPSKNVSVKITYPENLKLIREFYFNSNDSKTEDDSLGSYFLKINDWLLPDEGLVFQFR